MKRGILLILLLIIATISSLKAQTQLTEAVDFHVKTIDGVPLYLFPLLDDDNYIVVIDFFSTSCGPCQEYAADFQESYEYFGENTSNVFFMGINWGSDNASVKEFDSIHGLTYPTASGSQGGGNIVFNDYEIMSYPTVIVITPDHSIVEQYIWYPTSENIIEAILNAGGVTVGTNEFEELKSFGIFPNPVSSVLNIKLSNNNESIKKIDIFHISGQKVMTINTPASSINVNSLEPGNYILSATYKNGDTERQKFVISR